jgi:hypothetical protein
MMHLAAGGVISLCCLAGPAWAESTPDQLAGRWVSAKPALVLDISPCGKGWCGVQVNDATCAHTALRLEVQPPDKAVRLAGTLLRAVGSKPYLVLALLEQRDGGLFLNMEGNTEDRGMTRIFEFRAAFARTGEATCAPDPKLS